VFDPAGLGVVLPMFDGHTPDRLTGLVEKYGFGSRSTLIDRQKTWSGCTHACILR
jgi:hypothetical protein